MSKAVRKKKIEKVSKVYKVLRIMLLCITVPISLAMACGLVYSVIAIINGLSAW